MFLITGATGNNGREVVKQLVDIGQSVRILVRNPEKAGDLQKLGVETATGDLENPESIDRALQGIEKALLLPANSLQQVQQERNFIEAAQRANVQHLVKFSALGADLPNPPVSLLRWHAEAEQILRDSGIPFTIIRPTTFMQNMLGSAATIQSEGKFYMALGDARVAQVDVRDIAAVIVAVLTQSGHEGKIYTVTGSEALTYGEVAEKLSAVLDKEITCVNISLPEWNHALVSAGMPQWFADAMVGLQEYVRKPMGSQITNTIAEVTKQQPITFDQFAKDYVSVFKG
jgi:uncharacterized protein YbjT (DUF2867 family)